MLSTSIPRSLLSALCVASAAPRVLAARFLTKAGIPSSNIQHHLEQEHVDDPDYHSTYFDMQATTPIDPRVLDAMEPYLTYRFGNPHSTSHRMGHSANTAVDIGRSHIQELIGAKDASEVVFTSGATESNNTAIKGAVRYIRRGNPSKNHIITTPIEHKCILDTVRHLRDTEGCEVTYLPVNQDGLISPDELRKAITKNTALVTTMFVNNEIGVIQPVEEIGRICKEAGVLFHTDAAQALGKVDIDVEKLGIDMMSMSGHKIYGPKGIGALYVRKAKPRVRIEPLLNGGGQERGMRSGTLAPALIVGFGEACRIAKEEMVFDNAHVAKLFDMLVDGVTKNMEYTSLNGSRDHRYKGNANLSFKFIEGESLMLHLSQYMLSSGSACTSASLEPSYVLHALGVPDDVAHTSIRFGMGRFTTEQDVKNVLEALKVVVPKLREMSPLYDMVVNEGVDISSIKWTE